MSLLLLAALAHADPLRTIRVDRTDIVRTFDPATAFGGGIDGHEKGDVMTNLTPANVGAMKAMGLRSLTYRLRTELGGEVWHWNPEGSWSEPGRNQGYWTSSAASRTPILLTYGYRLPRRGDTLDQANRDGYSRLDDGDLDTFWKSNPYLDPVYTGVPYAQSPQWIEINFSRPHRLNELRIAWGEPYARRYRVSYLEDGDDKQWKPLALRPLAGSGPYARRAFAPVEAQRVMIELVASSNTAPKGSHDVRDRLGFAVREIALGLSDGAGRFRDAIVHRRNNQVQTVIYVSSTDPWHRARDLDPRTEQPGFDLVLRSGLAQREPLLIPTGCLYDTPANVANEARWLKAHRVPLRGLELGEEPDGNWVYPEHYARLYLLMADAVRKVLPTTPIGGPSFQTVVEDYAEFPRNGKPWLSRFKEELADRKRLSDFAFCSFEWYPFDDVWSPAVVHLPTMAAKLGHVLDRLDHLGMAGMPWYITEYGYSAYAAPAEVDAPGAVFDFDTALTALSRGCACSYKYGYEAADVIAEMPHVYGNNMALMGSTEPPLKMPTFWSAWLLTHVFCATGPGHDLLGVSGGDAALGAYACRRPDGSVMLALLNRTDHDAMAAIETAKPRLSGFTYGRPNFAWKHVRPDSRPDRNVPPTKVTVDPKRVRCPGYSITILRL